MHHPCLSKAFWPLTYDNDWHFPLSQFLHYKWHLYLIWFGVLIRSKPAWLMEDCPPLYACVKGHLEPTHLKSSPLFTFSTKSLGQDSPSIHLLSKIIGSRFTTAKIKLGEDSPSWFVFSRSRFTFKQRK